MEIDPRIQATDIRAALADLGAEIIPFDSRYFGNSYPYGNKIEMLGALPKDEPFVFFDTDTLITGALSDVPFDFDRPGASLRREGTWPIPQLYGPGYTGLWKSLYDKFELDFDSSLDLTQPDEYWQRYLYFNAGFFYYRCPHVFGEKFLEYALAIRDNPPVELCAQSFDPWLDQIALPLVIHALGGGKDSLPPGLLDGSITCHYRLLPLLYARESDHAIQVLERVTAPNKLKKVLKGSEAVKRMVYQAVATRSARFSIRTTCRARNRRSATGSRKTASGFADPLHCSQNTRHSVPHPRNAGAMGSGPPRAPVIACGAAAPFGHACAPPSPSPLSCVAQANRLPMWQTPLGERP